MLSVLGPPQHRITPEEKTVREREGEGGREGGREEGGGEGEEREGGEGGGKREEGRERRRVDG